MRIKSQAGEGTYNRGSPAPVVSSFRISSASRAQDPQLAATPSEPRSSYNELMPDLAARRICLSVTALQMQTYMVLPVNLMRQFKCK